MSNNDSLIKKESEKLQIRFSKSLRDLADMSSEELFSEVERLESYVNYAEGTDRDQALLRLCALLLQRPELDKDGQSASWAGRKLQVLLEDFYSGKDEIKLDRGNSRKSFSHNGRDPATGLRWPTAILFEYDTQPKKNKLKGDSIEERVHRTLLRRGFPFGPSQIKTMYYQAIKSQSYKKEINDPVARPRGIRKAQVDAALLLVCLDSLHTAQPHPNPLFLLQLQHNSHPSKTHHPTDLVSNPASS